VQGGRLVVGFVEAGQGVEQVAEEAVGGGALEAEMERKEQKARNRHQLGGEQA